jgi:protein-disulfide isomerase
VVGAAPVGRVRPAPLRAGRKRTTEEEFRVQTRLWLSVLPLLALVACGRPQGTAGDPAPPTDVAAQPGASAPAASPVGATGAVSATGTLTTTAAAGPTVTPDPTVTALLMDFELPVRGDPEAPVLMYEFSDYLCPYCRRFAADNGQALKEEYLDTGKIQLVYIDFPLQSHGYPALVTAEGAHCAEDEGKYWEMHDALFASFLELNELDISLEEPAREKVIEIGAGIGLDEALLRECLETQKYRPIVASLWNEGRARNVEVTPTFMIGPASGNAEPQPVLGFLPMEEMRPILDRAYSRALGTPVADPTARPEETPAAGDEAASPTP